MQKISKMLKKIDINIVLIIVLITIIFSRIFLDGMVYGHDSFVHLFRIANMSSNIVDGDIFSKIGYNYINGFGYGTGIFYPQINLYLSSIFYIFIRDVNTSLKIYVYVNSLLSGIIMYSFLKYKLKDRKNAFVGSLLYIFSPYFYVQSMIRGATGETVIFLSLPLIFYGLERIFDRKNYGILMVIIGGVYVLQSHLISTIYVILFAILYLIINYRKVFNKVVLFDIIKSVVIIFLVSLYFIIPFIEHYIIGEYNMIVNVGGDVSKSVLPIGQVVFNNGKYNIGIILICLLFSLPLVFNKLKDDKSIVKKYLLMGVISIFMITCPYIWGKIRYLDIIQFPWRLLSSSIFFLVIVDTYLIKNMNLQKDEFSIFLMILICLSFYQLNDYVCKTNIREAGFDLDTTVEKQVIDENNMNLHSSLGSNDYLPIECDIKYIASRGNSLIVNKGKLKSVKNYKFKNGLISADIKIEGDTKIELPLIYYLGYNIALDGKKINYVKDKNGFIEINVKKSGNLKVKYTGTKLDIFANVISIMSTLFLIVYYLYKFINDHRNIKKNS